MLIKNYMIATCKLVRYVDVETRNVNERTYPIQLTFEQVLKLGKAGTLP